MLKEYKSYLEIGCFKDELFKQFMADSYLPTPKSKKNSVLINLQNGTFEITPAKRGLRQFDQKDFITHQLPFSKSQEAYELYASKKDGVIKVVLHDDH